MVPAHAEASAIDGGEVLVQTLVRAGVKYVFNIPGLGMYPLMDAIHRHRHELRYITATNETNLGLIANGYARASGEPAFLCVYHASGTALAMMAITTAWAESVPLVMATVTSSRATQDRDQYAAVPRDITEMSQQFVKWSATVPSVDRIAEYTERALRVAGTAPFGPVHLALPMDLLDDPFVPGRGQYDTDRADIVFDDVTASDAAVDTVIQRLKQCRQPVVIAGGEVVRYGAVEALAAFVERLCCPVISEPFIADLAFPSTHDHYVGKLPANRDLVDSADLVLLIGAELTDSGYGTPMTFPDQSVVINMTIDPHGLFRQTRPSVAVVGHPRTTLEKLVSALDSNDSAGLQEADDVLGTRRHAIQNARSRRAGTADKLRGMRWDQTHPMSAARVIHALAETMPDNACVVNQAGTAATHVELLLDVADPRRYFGISGKASALGWAGPAAIGIQLARPEQRVVALLGDGCTMVTASALYTASQFHIPVVFLVLNNGGWVSQVAGMHHGGLAGAQSSEEFGWMFTAPPINYVELARAFGLHADGVGDADALRTALVGAFAAPKPVLIEIDCTRGEAEDFFRLLDQ